MNDEISAGRLLAFLTEYIEPVCGREEARSISLMIIEKKYGFTLKDVAAGTGHKFAEREIIDINNILRRLILHEPIQYILGEAFFYDRWFMVNPSVLIPRPETEELCAMVIRENTTGNLKVLDIGTGSGCIAVILSLHMNDPVVFGWDISSKAIETARNNARKFRVKTGFEIRDILNLSDPTEKFNIIVCNPPYVTRQESKDMRKNVLDYEPVEAIFTEGDPLKFYRAILDRSEEILESGGRMYFEINESAGDGIHKLMQSEGMREIRIIKDMHGKDRFAAAMLR